MASRGKLVLTVVLMAVVVGVMVALAAGGCGWLAGQPSPTVSNPVLSPTGTSTAVLPTATAVVALPSTTSTPTGTSTATPTPSPSASPTPWAEGFRATFEQRPLAIMVDNAPSARPQSGLNSADVVLEALVEAGITRFMAIFGNGDSPVVGAVRSTRHYFVYWAMEYGAVLVHAGYSPQGFTAIDEVGIPRLDFNAGTGVFWRVDRPWAQGWENLYTSTLRSRELASPGTGHLGSLKFKPDQPRGEVSHITVVHPGGYTTEYRYDQATNSYLRFMAGAPHIDEHTSKQYQPRNIIVQLVEVWPIPNDDKGRVDMAQVGRGAAFYFLDGTVVTGAWEKESNVSPTRFLDASGAEVRFNGGQTWIQVVPPKSTVRYR